MLGIGFKKSTHHVNCLGKESGAFDGHAWEEGARGYWEPDPVGKRKAETAVYTHSTPHVLGTGLEHCTKGSQLSRSLLST